MVSTNAAGARSVRYGSVRPWVDGLTLITVDGETVPWRGESPRRAVRRSGGSIATRARPWRPLDPSSRPAFPDVRKNSSGYALDAYLASGDVLDLVVGAEGTLGIVTEIEWRLSPLPPQRAGLRVTLRSLDQLSQAIDYPVLSPAIGRWAAGPELSRSCRIGGAGKPDPDHSDAERPCLLVELERNGAESCAGRWNSRRSKASAGGSISRDRVLGSGRSDSGPIRHAASPIWPGCPRIGVRSR